MIAFSRRSLLAGVAAIPAAIAIPALTAEAVKLPVESISPVVTANPDEKLFVMKQLEAAYAKWQAYADSPARRKAMKRYNKLAGPEPDFPWMRPFPAKIAKFLPRIEKGKPRIDIMAIRLSLYTRRRAKRGRPRSSCSC